MSEQPQNSYSWRQLDDYCQRVMSALAVVELIGREHSKSEAAHILDVTPNAIRQRLPPVQNRLGGPVIDEKSDFTPLGKAMSRLWQGVRPMLESFIGDVQMLKDQRELRLSTIRSVWEVEGDWIESEYQKRLPGGSLEVKFADSFHLIEHQVRYGQADIGIASFPPKDSEIRAPVKIMKWRDEQMVLVAQYYRAQRVVNARALESWQYKDFHQTFFTMNEQASMYEPVSRYLKKNGVNFPYKTPVETIHEAVDLIKKDLGISILPLPAIKNAFTRNTAADRRFKDDDLDYFYLKPPLQRPIVIVYREDTLKTELQADFLDVLKKNTERPKPEDVEPSD